MSYERSYDPDTNYQTKKCEVSKKTEPTIIIIRMYFFNLVNFQIIWLLEQNIFYLVFTRSPIPCVIKCQNCNRKLTALIVIDTVTVSALIHIISIEVKILKFT